jgi:hypothetical protein
VAASRPETLTEATFCLPMTGYNLLADDREVRVRQATELA